MNPPHSIENEPAKTPAPPETIGAAPAGKPELMTHPEIVIEQPEDVDIRLANLKSRVEKGNRNMTFDEAHEKLEQLRKEIAALQEKQRDQETQKQWKEKDAKVTETQTELQRMARDEHLENNPLGKRLMQMGAIGAIDRASGVLGTGISVLSNTVMTIVDLVKPAAFSAMHGMSQMAEGLGHRIGPLFENMKKLIQRMPLPARKGLAGVVRFFGWDGSWLETSDLPALSEADKKDMDSIKSLARTLNMRKLVRTNPEEDLRGFQQLKNAYVTFGGQYGELTQTGRLYATIDAYLIGVINEQITATQKPDGSTVTFAELATAAGQFNANASVRSNEVAKVRAAIPAPAPVAYQGPVPVVPAAPQPGASPTPTPPPTR